MMTVMDYNPLNEFILIKKWEEEEALHFRTTKTTKNQKTKSVLHHHCSNFARARITNGH